MKFLNRLQPWVDGKRGWTTFLQQPFGSSTIDSGIPLKATTDMTFDHFLQAQEGSYEVALSEIKRGCKTGHWMWFMFPQLQGLGSSATAQKYALDNLNEAKEYLAHPLLGARLIHLTEAFASVENKSAYQILGTPDDLKMKSSMTLFSLCSGEGSVFHQILQKYYDGQRCSYTERICTG